MRFARCLLSFCAEFAFGEFEIGRAQLERAADLCDELGLTLQRAFVSMGSGELELMAGEFPAAERVLRQGHQLLEQIREKSYLSTMAALLAQGVQSRLEKGQGRDPGNFDWILEREEKTLGGADIWLEI